MINSSNISDYISYLYQQKYGTSAPLEVLESWTQLSNEDLETYLPGFYAHWNLNPEEIKRYEQDFLSQTKRFDNRVSARKPLMPEMPVSSPTQPAQPTSPQLAAPSKKSKFWKVFLILLFFLMMATIAYLAYNLMYQPEKPLPEPTEAVVESNPHLGVEVPIDKEMNTPSENISGSDYENIMNLKNLFKAEETRNLNEILNAFSPHVEQYWDISYPTEEELALAYERTWEITKDNKNTNIQITKSNENTYDVQLNYSYFSLNTNKQKTVHSKVRFIFDEDHKIIKTYGLK